MPASSAAPRPVASRTGEISTGRWVASASACTNVGLSVIPPSTRTWGMVIPLSAIGGVDQVGAAVRDPFEHRACDLGAPGPAREPEERRTGAVVPGRSPEPERRGHEHDASAVGTRRGQRVRLVGARDDSEVVAEPLHVGPGREHHGLDAPDATPAVAPGHDRERPVLISLREPRR